jgi:fluoroquinolone transport system permease protein
LQVYWLDKLFSFQLTSYYLLADTVTICMGPMMTGVMTGLLMLDERDEGS